MGKAARQRLETLFRKNAQLYRPDCAYGIPAESPAIGGLFYPLWSLPLQKQIIPGLDSSERLRRWFLAKEHQFLVFKIADILELPEDQQLTFLELNQRINGSILPSSETDIPLRRQLQRIGVRGYVRWPVASVCKWPLADLEVIQQICSDYRDVRQGKMEPSRVEPCGCGGRSECPHCSGHGTVRILDEMSALEIALAEGKSWTEAENLR